MNNQHFTLTLVADTSANEAFDAINDIQRWWSEEFTGNSREANAEFEVRFGNVHYSRQKLTEIIPGKKVAWLVTDSYLSFLEDKNEWTGTTIHFDISEEDNKTKIVFSHLGLVPQIQCYGDCSNAWKDYLENSLVPLMTTGQGKPNKKKTITASITTS